MPLVFLLSPAWCGGRRAKILLRPGSEAVLAVQLRSGTLTLGDAFAFMSGLYFRGKIAYARAFAVEGESGAPALFVITPTRGLLSPDAIVSRELLEEFAAVDVSADDPRYREPLIAAVRKLADDLDPDARVVLLGSVATGKYVDVLTTILGTRLHYPLAFIGRGDMSRGGLLLRSAASGEELEYAPLEPGAIRRGPRPPKLEPLAAWSARRT